jgi:hypothetical protein
MFPKRIHCQPLKSSAYQYSNRIQYQPLENYAKKFPEIIQYQPQHHSIPTAGQFRREISDTIQ